MSSFLQTPCPALGRWELVKTQQWEHVNDSRPRTCSYSPLPPKLRIYFEQGSTLCARNSLLAAPRGTDSPESARFSHLFTAPGTKETITLHHHLFPNKVKLYRVLSSTFPPPLNLYSRLCLLAVYVHLLLISSFICHHKDIQVYMAH